MFACLHTVYFIDRAVDEGVKGADVGVMYARMTRYGVARAIDELVMPRHVCVGGGLLGLSELDQRLWRAKLASRKSKDVSPRLTGKWRSALCAYARVLKSDARALLYAMSERIPVCCEVGIIAGIKAVSTLCIGATVHLGEGPWTYLCDAHILGGYDTLLNRVDVMEGVKDAVGVGGPHLMDDWEAKLRASVRASVRKIGGKQHSGLGFRDWVRFRDGWAGPGACDVGKRVVLEVQRSSKTETIRIGSKCGRTLGMTDDELIALMLEEAGSQIRPFRKTDEPVKTRAVFGYPMASYLRCSYADTFLGNYNKNGVWTTLGCSSLERAQLRNDIWTRLGSHLRAVSLDQASFDLNQPKFAVRMAIEEIWNLIVERECLSGGDVRELEELRRLELFAFDNAYIEGVCSWEKGVPSGHKWTALIDTLLNAAECELAAELRGVKVSYGLFQGDDGLVFESGKPKMSWSAAYKLLGLEVNDTKTWVDRSGCEFLHEFYSPTGVRAFPARVFKGILWRKPETGGVAFKSGESHFREKMSLLLKCSRRGLLDCDVLAIQELRSKGIDSEAAKEIVGTPIALGGLGWGELGRMKLVVEGGELRRQKVSIASKVAVIGGDVDWKEWALTRLGASVPLPTVPLTYSAARVRCRKDTPTMMRRYTQFSNLKMTWHWTDVVPGGDPWVAAVSLEEMLAGRRIWQDELVPDQVCRSSVLGSERAFRFVSKYYGAGVSLENAHSTGESWCAVSDTVCRIWKGLVVSALECAKLRNDMTGAYLGLCRFALEAVRGISYLPVRV
jgi:hypothetical protein